MKMYDAGIERPIGLETTVREHLQHRPVLAQHVGLEFRDRVCIGDQTQMFEQQCAYTVALELVQYRERDFRATWVRAANVTADADEALATVLGQRRRQADVIFEVELGQPPEILRRQIAFDPHETKIHGLLAEAREMLVQAILIVRANRTDSDRGAVERHRIDAIIPRVTEYVAICHRTGGRV